MPSFAELVEKYRANRRILLLIVYVALFLDNMLLTTVVPIIPEYLLRISHPNSTDMLLHNKLPLEGPTTPSPPIKQRLRRQSLYDPNTTDSYSPSSLQRDRRQVDWDSAQWDDESWGGDASAAVGKKARATTRRPALPKPSQISSSNSAGGGDGSGGRGRPYRPHGGSGGVGRMKPATTTTTEAYTDGDSASGSEAVYDELPDEFSVGFQGSDWPKNIVPPPRTGVRPSSTTKMSGSERFRQKQEKIRHDTLAEENVHVGLMFGSKALIQLLVNPMIGPLTNKIGYTVPMFCGFCIMFLSTLLFAFGSSYGTLWMARALQGVGSACTSTSGMGMLAQAYPDDAERGSAMGIALGGLALGVLVGPPYGGLLYEWAGKALPFILLALLALGDGVLQFFVLQPKIDRGEPEGTAIKELATDPYILVAAGSITIGNLGIAMIEPSLPLWMMESWGASSIERGAAFLPASVSYLIGTNIFGPLAHKIGRWLSGFIGLVVIGFCLLAIPSARSVGGLIIPHFFMGFSIGMIDASMFPLMGFIVDVRHVGVYGSIYAIADAAFCFAFALGPFFSGPLVRNLGFPSMMYLIALINFAYAPLLFILRGLPESAPPPPMDGAAAIRAANGPPAGRALMETVVDGNPLHYDKIEGLTGLSDSQVAYNPSYNYNIPSVWDD